jgi:hypothetical protein
MRIKVKLLLFLSQIQELARNSPDATLLLVNPQWNNSGQVVSDFGFGPWKRKAEEFLGTFRPTFELVEQVRGSNGRGGHFRTCLNVCGICRGKAHPNEAAISRPFEGYRKDTRAFQPLTVKKRGKKSRRECLTGLRSVRRFLDFGRHIRPFWEGFDEKDAAK